MPRHQTPARTKRGAKTLDAINARFGSLKGAVAATGLSFGTLWRTVHDPRYTPLPRTRAKLREHGLV